MAVKTKRAGVVLVVDDDDMVREVMSKMLVRAGYDVRCAADGHGALERIAETDVDAIVLDMAMPRMSGEELIQELAHSRPELVARVIIVTGNPDDASEEYAMRMGVHDWLRKPCQSVTLERKVQQVMTEAAVSERTERGQALTKCLTRRQRQVLIGLAEGKPVKRIADELGVSVRTAREHKLKGLRRIGMYEVTEWTRFAAACGLVGESPTAADVAD